MAPSGFPTGTVSSGRDDTPPVARDDGTRDDLQARIAALERENEALRAAVERQRRENDRIVERYERERAGSGNRGQSPGSDGAAATGSKRSVFGRLADAFGSR
jgi:hypothetical protein